MTSVLKQPYFHDEQAAFAALEAIMWPSGKPDHCPHCGCADQDKMNRLAVQRSKPSKRNPNGKAVYGLWKCYACRRQFTVRKGTIFEESRLELTLWFQAAFLMCSSKKGVSANQLHRTLGVTLKTAWFLAHRIREAMRDGSLPPLGGEGKIVEADETYQGRKSEVRETTTSGRPFTKPRGKVGKPAKRAIIALVERGGAARMFHVDRADKATVNQIVSENIAREANVMTDESRLYGDVKHHAASHRAVKHAAGEYVRYEDGLAIHSNTVENVFSILKRGMTGVYQHCDEKHLHRYLAEFGFRYNNRAALGVDDVSRTTNALAGTKGKRLTYQRIDGAAEA